MAVLKNPKHELFAQELAKGKTQVTAYEMAGYKPNDSNAAQLAKRPDINGRVTEINGKAADIAGISVARMAQMFIEDRELARECKQVSAAVSAGKCLGELFQLFVEQVHTTGELTIKEPVDRPLRESHDEWVNRRKRELGTVGATTGSTNGSHNGRLVS